MKFIWCWIFILFLMSGCVSNNLIEKGEKEIRNNKEYNDVVKIKVIPPPPKPKAEIKPVVKKNSAVKDKKPKKKKVYIKKITPLKKIKVTKKLRRRPKLEDVEGFNGRRPLIDPFTQGEKVTLSMRYFKMAAGDMTLETLPFVEVNGSKAYHFRITLKSSSMFSLFYKLDDMAETFVDYKTLRPYTLNMTVKESKQLKDIKSYFDWKKNEATLWWKKISEDKGKEEKKISWKIEPYAQNVISAAFYLRNFTLKPGKSLAFRVADEGKNLVFTGKVLRREKLKTAIGTFDTVVVKPKITVDGMFKPVGEILMWLTDDDRKLLIRIESKIKVGTIIGELKDISY